MSGKYIVVFKNSATQDQINQYVNDVKSNGGAVTHEYSAVMKGFAAEIPNAYFARLNSFQSDENSPIDYIEPDGVVTTQ